MALAIAAGVAAVVLLGAGSADENASPDQPAEVRVQPIVDIAPIGEPGDSLDLPGGKGKPLTVE